MARVKLTITPDSDINAVISRLSRWAIEVGALEMPDYAAAEALVRQAGKSGNALYSTGSEMYVERVIVIGEHRLLLRAEYPVRRHSLVHRLVDRLRGYNELQ